MMRSPLDQFAERLIRNGEVGEFIEGLVEKTDYEFVKKIVEKALANRNHKSKHDSRPEYMRHY